MNRPRSDAPQLQGRLKSWTTAAVGMAYLMIVPGCDHAEARVPLVPVSGKVFFEGQPADGAVVKLHHTDPAMARRIKPTGIVEPDGTFKIGTYEDEDGAPPGNYKATFEWSDPEDGVSRLPFPFGSPELSNFHVKVTDSPAVLPTFEFHKPEPSPTEKPDFMR